MVILAATVIAAGIWFRFDIAQQQTSNRNKVFSTISAQLIHSLDRDQNLLLRFSFGLSERLMQKVTSPNVSLKKMRIM